MSKCYLHCKLQVIPDRELCEKIKASEHIEFNEEKVEKWLKNFDWKKISEEVKSSFNEK